MRTTEHCTRCSITQQKRTVVIATSVVAIFSLVLTLSLIYSRQPTSPRPTTTTVPIPPSPTETSVRSPAAPVPQSTVAPVQPTTAAPTSPPSAVSVRLPSAAPVPLSTIPPTIAPNIPSTIAPTMPPISSTTAAPVPPPLAAPMPSPTIAPVQTPSPTIAPPPLSADPTPAPTVTSAPPLTTAPTLAPTVGPVPPPISADPTVSPTVAPVVSQNTEIWQPPPRTSWQWQLQGTIDTSFDVDVYDIDLYDTPQETIDSLHAMDRKVICYFSAGSYENFRDDKDQFTSDMLGNPFADFPDEQWLDIRNAAIRPIMEARMQLAAEKRCDGVEPDNVDGYINDTGFPLAANDQLVYNRWLANAAHGLGLSVGLKNDLDQVNELVDLFDFAVNEQCFQYNECDRLEPFIQSGKAVFGVEYEESPAEFCPILNAMGFSWLEKDYDLFATPRIDCMVDFP